MSWVFHPKFSKRFSSHCLTFALASLGCTSKDARDDRGCLGCLGMLGMLRDAQGCLGCWHWESLLQLDPLDVTMLTAFLGAGEDFPLQPMADMQQINTSWNSSYEFFMGARKFETWFGCFIKHTSRHPSGKTLRAITEL